ncbi:antiterminator Q family protein [Citrobacter sp. Cf108]|uniref:antiterminator Q family protein n=1 Tax=Citrobacter sp. Cf108 TaxID=2985063 RepID=UPI00257629A4|nr:antiterminator Q family protein [Citrobacter sp. Cf108]MDM3177705.1 antiterminator Q family protein [Citrobacter sp. Cf108]
MRDIQMVLKRWGGWVASDSSGVNYSPVAAGFKGLLPQTCKTRLSCSDNDGLIINGAMARLKKHDPFLCVMLEWYYIHCIPVRVMGTKLGISHTQVLKRLQAAEGFIEGCLAMVDVTLEMDIECPKKNTDTYEAKKVVEFQKAI